MVFLLRKPTKMTLMKTMILIAFKMKAKPKPNIVPKLVFDEKLRKE